MSSLIENIDGFTDVFLFTNPVTNGLFLDVKSNGLLVCETEGVAKVFKAIFLALKNCEIEKAPFDHAIVYANNLSDGKITMITFDKLKNLKYN